MYNHTNTQTCKTIRYTSEDATLGRRRMPILLKSRYGINIGAKKCHRLKKKLGLRSLYPHRDASKPNPGAENYTVRRDTNQHRWKRPLGRQHYHGKILENIQARVFPAPRAEVSARSRVYDRQMAGILQLGKASFLAEEQKSITVQRRIGHLPCRRIFVAIFPLRQGSRR